MRLAMLVLSICDAVCADYRQAGRLTSNQLTDVTIHNAVSEWCAGGLGKTEVENDYGPIANWDTSQVTKMNNLLED
jgi:hypothetical protein